MKKKGRKCRCLKEQNYDNIFLFIVLSSRCGVEQCVIGNCRHGSGTKAQVKWTFNKICALVLRFCLLLSFSRRCCWCFLCLLFSQIFALCDDFSLLPRNVSLFSYRCVINFSRCINLFCMFELRWEFEIHWMWQERVIFQKL